MVDRLAEDHANAKRLAEGLRDIAPKAIDIDSVETNIVMFDASAIDKDATQLMATLRDGGVLTSMTRPGTIRMLTHNDVSAQDIDAAIGAFAGVLR